MKQRHDYDWFVTVSVIIGVAVLGLGLSALKDVSTNTILWLIFAAVFIFGRAYLAGQATGLGEIIDILRRIEGERAQEAINTLEEIRSELNS